MPAQWTPEWSNAVFSLEERDRRWGKVRALMTRAGIDLIVCLPNTSHHGRGLADHRYLTQLGENSEEVTVAFPLEGEVTAWHSRGGVWPSSNWLTDVRAAGRGTGGATIVQWVREHPRFEDGVMSIAGLDSSDYAHVRQAEGDVNWRSVEMLKEALPGAKLVDATPVLGEARWRKSAEEIAFLRQGVAVAEQTLQAVVEHARAGVPERLVFAHMMFANAAAGGSFTPMFGWASGPLGHVYHRVEQPTFRALEAGDVLALEIEGRWGGYIAQIDETLSVGPAHPDLRAGLQLACEAFNRVFERLRPGARLADLIAAGRVTGLGGRASTGLGIHGRGTGEDGPLVVGEIMEGGRMSGRQGRAFVLAGGPAPPELEAIEIQEGCCFVVKPSAAVDGKPDYGRWGETVVVTATGAERLGTRPQVLHELI